MTQGLWGYFFHLIDKVGHKVFILKDENKVVNVVDGKAELNYTFKNTGINVVTISYNDGYYYGGRHNVEKRAKKSQMNFTSLFKHIDKPCRNAEKYYGNCNDTRC